MNKKEQFLKLKTHLDIAKLFDISFNNFKKIFYQTSKPYQYKSIEILKKNGGVRTIHSPNKKIKSIQRQLSDILYEIYPVKPSAHGFIKNKSIVTNATQHLGKKFIFNIDLKDFFGSIHYGRIKNLFMSDPFRFNQSVAIILAHICCFDNKLPQGAPTSPILTNMICWKLDSQLQKLAKTHNCTYTRYVDDITFSFTCTKFRLPRNILYYVDSDLIVGKHLNEIIEANGFKINFNKVRLTNPNMRMEVTGLTINEFPNVKRKYIRQINSILYAWKKFGYEATETELITKYYSKHRASSEPPSLISIMRGKIAFLQSVRGIGDSIYIKIAKRYNDLVPDDSFHFKIIEIDQIKQEVSDCLWVVEAFYIDKDGDELSKQGTGFSLKNIGIITCAHVVVGDDKKILNKIKVYRSPNMTEEYILKVKFIDEHRDIAICEALNYTTGLNFITFSDEQIINRNEVELFGFPAYKYGQTPYIVSCRIASIYTHSCVKKFEIDTQIREGNSGGPIVNKQGELLGIVLEGAQKDYGNNACLAYTEIIDFCKNKGIKEYPSN